MMHASEDSNQIASQHRAADPSRTWRIDQLIPSFARYDAIGTHATNIQMLLRARGFISEIFTEIPQLSGGGDTKLIGAYHDVVTADSLCIYHHSTGSLIPRYLMRVPGKKITLYHNVTPPYFYEGVGEFGAARSCRDGILELDTLNIASDDVWTVSRYNTLDLEDAGMRDAKIFPILKDYSHMASLSPPKAIKERFSDGRLNLLFVGRIAPNKGQHDLIKMLIICRTLNIPARLILIGGITPGYLKQIKRIASQSGFGICVDHRRPDAPVADVLVTGQVSDEEMSGFYRNSDFFVSMSDHEGFCVPLVEAMYFGLPIIAHGIGAVVETLGDGGLIVDKHAEHDFVGKLCEVLLSKEAKKQLGEQALSRAEHFAWPRLEERFDEVLAHSLRGLGLSGHLESLARC